MRSLYLCYFGLREPLVQTQVLPYLRQLRQHGVVPTLLTFEPYPPEKWVTPTAKELKASLCNEGIRWISLPYHKRPSLPATLYDTLVGAWLAARLVQRDGVDILHGRAHVGAAMATLAKRFSRARVIFDIRGFNAEEYVDAGRWRNGGLKFRLTKRAEQFILAEADGFVVLTEKAKEILFPGCGELDKNGRPIEVIPCCVDLDRFAAVEESPREELRKRFGFTGRRVIAYAGALGGWYMTQEMVDLLVEARRADPSTLALILTQSSAEEITAPLRQRGFCEADFVVRKVPPSDVPAYLRAADVALSLIKPCFSKLSSSPTKIAEYLASGLPIISSAGIGDLDVLLRNRRIGVLVSQFNHQAYRQALSEMDELQRDEGLADRCRLTAQNEFDLQTIGGPRYRRLYDAVLGDGEQMGATK